MQGMLFSLMILGAFLKKKGIITDEGKRVIADLVIFVTLPCSIIESFEVELSMDILKSSAQALLVSCMVQVACYILNMVLYPGVGEEKKKVLKYATTAILAAKYGGDEVFATKCVVFTTLLSMVSAPVWCMVLQR